jgi:hypothetical protein
MRRQERARRLRARHIVRNIRFPPSDLITGDYLRPYIVCERNMRGYAEHYLAGIEVIYEALYTLYN